MLTVLGPRARLYDAAGRRRTRSAMRFAVAMTRIDLEPYDIVETPNIPDAKDRIPSLLAKAIDAATVADPFVAIAEHEGLVRVIDNFCKYDQMPSC